MRILIVGMAQSVHLARWIHQFDGTGWDIHLFPADWPCTVHPEMPEVTLHGVGLWEPPGLPLQIKVRTEWPFKRGGVCATNLLQQWRPAYLERVRVLWRTVRAVKPDMIHCFEMQHAGYLLLDALRIGGTRGMPPVVYSCWGNDIYHFGRFPVHAERIRAFLSRCDFMMADCYRDLKLASEAGFEGESLGYFPGPGGYDIDRMLTFRTTDAVHTRRTIAVKGYDHWGGRALLALRALDRCRDLLKEYEIVVYSASDSVRAVVGHMTAVSGLNISVMPASGHDEMMKLMGRARLAIGVSVTDGTPNSMLEAMVIGALPIQSDTVSTGEWIEDGVNGLLVRPEDEAQIQQAIRRALTDDALVDRAAVRNLEISRKRIDRTIVLPEVLAAYRKVEAFSQCGGTSG